jgi:predicted dehydrogenase
METRMAISNNILNTALIGYGYAGKTFHAPLIQSTPGLKLTTVVSSDAPKVLADLPQVKVEADANSMFADPNIDLVVIATPNQTHFELAAHALNSGKNVVIDKPFVTSVKEASELSQVCKTSGKVASVFQNRRWDADFLTLKKLLSTGRLGEVMYFQSNFDRYRPEVRARWREQPLKGSGLWFDLGSHLIDQALVLFGTPDKVLGDLAVQRQGAQAVDYFHVILGYGKKRVVLHASSLVPADSPRFVVHGTKASYLKYGLDTQEDSLKDGKRPGSNKWGLDPRLGTLSTRTDTGDLQTDSVPNELGNYSAYYDAVRDAILLGAENPVDLEQATAVMAILESQS